MDTARLEDLSREELIDLIREKSEGGIHVVFSGKNNARSLARKVRPRVTRHLRKYSAGTAEQQARNHLIEGDNLQAMATLYKERGQVDLILTDPPYNTGSDWRYNDKWDDDPNDPGLGDWVLADDGAKHTKWMKFMWPRLQIMRSMLKPTGVIAVCIDHREIYRLGQMLDELFGEENRVALINWQKTTALRSDSGHVTSTTEYVLVYAKDKNYLSTQRLDRDEKSNRRYGNPDGDIEGDWREGNLTARTFDAKNYYAIQSPFTQEYHYPAGNGAWRHPKRNIMKWLKEWGIEYQETDLNDGHAKALTIKPMKGQSDSDRLAIVTERLESGPWPFVWFGMNGQGRPRVKTYLQKVKKGAVPETYWADEEMSEIADIGSTSWGYSESGRTSDGVGELNAIVGKGHGFDTVKPLKLMKKIIQIWCPPDGLVLDPFAGSGTTGQAVVEMNRDLGHERRFILIEQGRPEKGDSYAKTLTADRLQRVAKGDWANGKATAAEFGFKFLSLGNKVDANALLQMEREEMVDTVIASHFDSNRRGSSGLISVDSTGNRYLVARNQDNEGIYLVWDGVGRNTDFTEEVYESCSAEAERAGLIPRFHVYARLYMFQSEDVDFYQIPDRILADFGLNLRRESFNEVGK